jgi:hypothetical protein
MVDSMNHYKQCSVGGSEFFDVAPLSGLRFYVSFTPSRHLQKKKKTPKIYHYHFS